MEPLNLTVAFALSQLLLLVIVAGGLGFLRLGEGMRQTNDTLGQLHLLTWFALLTFGLLFISEDIFAKASPVFGIPNFRGLATKKVFGIIFILDLVWAAWLIRETGGPRNSPFTGVLFLLPTIAIFLREPPERFVVYAASAAVLFIAAFSRSRKWPDYHENELGDYALTLVTLGCLGVATLLGWATRPL